MVQDELDFADVKPALDVWLKQYSKELAKIRNDYKNCECDDSKINNSLNERAIIDCNSRNFPYSFLKKTVRFW